MTHSPRLFSLLWLSISAPKAFTLQFPSIVKTDSSPPCLQFISKHDSDKTETICNYGDSAPTVSVVRVNKREELSLLASRIALQQDAKGTQHSFSLQFDENDTSDSYHIAVLAGKLHSSCLKNAVLVLSVKDAIVAAKRTSLRVYRVQRADASTAQLLVKPMLSSSVCQVFTLLSQSWLRTTVDSLKTQISQCTSLNKWRASHLEEHCITLSFLMEYSVKSCRVLLLYLAEKQKALLSKIWVAHSTQYVSLFEHELVEVLQEGSDPGGEARATFLQRCDTVSDNINNVKDFLHTLQREQRRQLEVIGAQAFTQEVTETMTLHLEQYERMFDCLIYHVFLLKQLVMLLHTITSQHSAHLLEDSSACPEWLSKHLSEDTPSLDIFPALFSSIAPLETALDKYCTDVEAQLKMYGDQLSPEDDMHSKHSLLTFQLQVVWAYAKLLRSQCLTAKNLIISVQHYCTKKDRQKLQDILSTVNEQQCELSAKPWAGVITALHCGSTLRGFYCYDYLVFQVTLQTASRFIKKLQKEKRVSFSLVGARPHSEVVLDDVPLGEKPSDEEVGNDRVREDPQADDIDHRLTVQPDMSENQDTSTSTTLPTTPSSPCDEWSLVDDSSIISGSQHTDVCVQISSLQDLATLSFSLPIYSSVAATQDNILPHLSQSVHNCVELTHCLTYNIAGCTPYVRPVFHTSGHFLLWTLSEWRTNYPKKCLASEAWHEMKRALISSHELNAIEEALGDNQETLSKQVCCTSQNKPLTHIVYHQLIPLLLSILNYGFDGKPEIVEQSRLRWSIGSKRYSQEMEQQQEEVFVCSLWKYVGKSCNWIRDLLEHMQYDAAMSRNITWNLEESNRICAAVLVHAINEHALANCIVEFARNAKCQTFYPDGTILKNRTQLQTLVDLLSILDEHPLCVNESFISQQ